MSVNHFQLICIPLPHKLYIRHCKCKLKPSHSHQSEDVSWLLSSVINGTQRQAERHTASTISILNGHYSHKSPAVLLDNRQGLDIVKVNLCTFCSNISACILEWGPYKWGVQKHGLVQMGFILILFIYARLSSGDVQPERGLFQIYEVREEVSHSCTHADSSRDITQIKAIYIHFLHFVDLLVVQRW